MVSIMPGFLFGSTNQLQPHLIVEVLGGQRPAEDWHVMTTSP